jgi:hypothetical protein
MLLKKLFQFFQQTRIVLKAIALALQEVAIIQARLLQAAVAEMEVVLLISYKLSMRLFLALMLLLKN